MLWTLSWLLVQNPESTRGMYIPTPGSPPSLSPTTLLAWGLQASRWNLSVTSLRNLVLWFLTWNTVPRYSQGFLPFTWCLLKKVTYSDGSSRTDETKIAAPWLSPLFFSCSSPPDSGLNVSLLISCVTEEVGKMRAVGVLLCVISATKSQLNNLPINISWMNNCNFQSSIGAKSI